MDETAFTQWLMAPEAPDVEFTLEDLLRRPEWHRRAACRGAGVEVFFPSDGASFEAVRAFCVRCEVQEDCLKTALEEPRTRGTWGGTSEQERRELRRATRRAVA
jgi:WhiB family transcriptional regulator, redox-sensing transcriptional regulator